MSEFPISAINNCLIIAKTEIEQKKINTKDTSFSLIQFRNYETCEYF